MVDRAAWESVIAAQVDAYAPALGRLGAPAIFRLKEAAVDPDPNRRDCAAVALGATGAPGVDDVLERSLQDGATAAFGRQVRVAAKPALGTSQRVQAAKAVRRA